MAMQQARPGNDRPRPWVRLRALHRARRHEESGSALLLTMVFLSTIGILAGALISYELTLNKGAFVTRRTQAREAGVNAGVEWAVGSVREGRDSLCHGTGERQVLSVSDREVEVRCTVQPAYEHSGNGIAVYLNRTGAGELNVIRVKGEISPEKQARIVGPVYNGAGKSGWQLDGPLFVDGDVLQDDGGGECRTDAVIDPPSNLYGLYPNVKQCSLDISAVTPAEIKPPCGGSGACMDPRPVLLDAFGKETKDAPACKVWSPGTYTKAPALAANNYFRPGVYELLLGSEWKIGGAVRGGDPGRGSERNQPDQSLSSAPRCEGAPDAESPNGVVFVLGANTSIKVLDTARLELFAYQEGDVRLPSIVVGGWKGVTDWTKPSEVPLERDLVTVGPQAPEFLLHSGVFAPESGLRYDGGGDIQASIRNTVVVARLDLIAREAARGDFGIDARTSTSTKFFVTARSCPGLTTEISHHACSEPPAGHVEPELCASATVTVYDDANRTVYIDNWRIDRDPTAADPARCDQDPR